MKDREVKRFWIARDFYEPHRNYRGPCSLTLFEHEPYKGKEIWLPRTPDPGWFRKLPSGWYADIQPGECRTMQLTMEPSTS